MVILVLHFAFKLLASLSHLLLVLFEERQREDLFGGESVLRVLSEGALE